MKTLGKYWQAKWAEAKSKLNGERKNKQENSNNINNRLAQKNCGINIKRNK